MRHSLKELQSAELLGVKALKIEVFREDILPFSISWLILTGI